MKNLLLFTTAFCVFVCVIASKKIEMIVIIIVRY
jgi:hypothetical protein